jgi:hypothetical protein
MVDVIGDHQKPEEHPRGNGEEAQEAGPPTRPEQEGRHPPHDHHHNNQDCHELLAVLREGG